MKSATILSLGIFAFSVAAQDLSACGQTCFNNMIGLAMSLGCDSGDSSCLCQKVDFGYGVRDCSDQSCPDTADAAQAVSYAMNYCSSATAGGSSSTQPMTGGSSGSGSGSSSAITTSTYVSEVTATDGSVATSTGETTIFGVGPTGVSETAVPISTLTSVVDGATSLSTIYSGASATGTAAGSAISTVTTDGTTSTIYGNGASATASSDISSITGAAGSSIASISSAASSKVASASNAASSSTSKALGAMPTAVPGGLLAAAGIAALFL